MLSRLHIINHITPYLTGLLALGSLSLVFTLSHHLFNLPSLLIGTTFLVFWVSLAFFVLNKASKHLLYLLTYLLLGTLSLLSSHLTDGNSLNPAFLAFCKILSLGLASLVLSSTYWALSKRPKTELISNLFGVVFTIALVIVLYVESPTASAVHKIYDIFFTAIVGLSLLWIFPAGMMILREILKKKTAEKALPLTRYYQFVVLAAGLSAAMVALSFQKSLFSTPGFMRHFPEVITISHFALFSLLILLGGLFEHFIHIKQLEFALKQDKIKLDLIQVLGDKRKFKDIAHMIQEKVCKDLGCSTSTLYVPDRQTKNHFFEVNYTRGKSAASPAKREIPPNRGLIGRVITTRKPLLIKDMDRADEERGPKVTTSRDLYKTKSCIILPLILKKKLMGILSLRDKNQNQPFNKRDIALSESMAEELALIFSLVTEHMPDSGTSHLTDIEYYLEPFEDFTAGIHRFNEHLKLSKKAYTGKQLNLAVSSIQRLGHELFALANQVGNKMKTQISSERNRKAS